VRVTSAVLAHDAGPGAGLGHRRRMQALSRSLGVLGVDATLTEARHGATADLVVVDSYAHRADDRERFRGAMVAAVDDLQRDLAVDVVVDPSPGATSAPHGRAQRVLAGHSYAMIDPDLVARPRPPLRDTVARVLVTTGAADMAGSGAAVAGRLAVLMPNASVRLVIGPWGSAQVPAGVEAVSGLDGLRYELAQADLVVTAAGVTMLECLALGRPTVAFVTAANQLRAAENVARVGAAVLAPVDEAADAAARLAGDADRRLSLSNAAASLVDGLGCRRIAEVLVVALRRTSPT